MDTNYLAECLDLDLEPLEEAGGLRSWIKRFVTGSDHSLVAQLNVEVMHRVKTAEDKKKLLDEIDGYVSEAEGRSGKSDNRQYIENLKMVRARVAAAKTKD